MDAKRCSKCGATKPLMEFYGRKASPDGHQNYCKACVAVHNKSYYGARRAKYREYNRVNKLRSKYGLTPQEYDAILAAQSGRCAICVDVLQPGPQTHLDHCHTTGQIRGVLCQPCNLMVGHAQDDPERLERGAKYLRDSLIVVQSAA